MQTESKACRSGGGVGYLAPESHLIIRGMTERPDRAGRRGPPESARDAVVLPVRKQFMARRHDEARDLLFGALALERGVIDHAQLLAAFETWSRARDRPMAEI